jgi:phage repressor protein C with HTH and peptisase S24 domain
VNITNRTKADLMANRIDQSFAKALQYFRKQPEYRTYTQEKIAKLVGKSQGYVGKIERGENYGKEEIRRAIAALFGYDGSEPGKTYDDFLSLGRSIAFVDESKRQDRKPVHKTFQISGRQGEGEEAGPGKHAASAAEKPLVVDVVNGFEKVTLDENLDRYRGVPLYESGKLAAKVGGYSFDENEPPDSTVIIYQPELHGRLSHDLRALRVGGDSMLPRIPEGSIVVVDLNDKEFVDKKIYVVREPFSDPPIATVKRIRKVNQKHFQGFALVSENPEYLPEMTDLEWHELVVGRAVWMWRSLEEA